MPLLAELRRRNVFKVAGAYLALGWVIVQLTGRRLGYIVIGMLALAMLLFVSDRIVPRRAELDASRTEARPTRTVEVDGAAARESP